MSMWLNYCMSTENKTLAEQFPWLTVGAKAYNLYRGSWNYVSLTPVKVEKITKSRVTLSNGKVFYLRKYGKELKELGTDYYNSPELIPVDDPRVLETKKEIRKRNVEIAARNAAESFYRDKGVDNARKAIAALMDYVAEEEKEEN